MRRRWSRLRTLSGKQWGVVAESLLLVPVVSLALRRRGFVSTAGWLAHLSDGQQRCAAAGIARPTADAVALVAGRRGVGTHCLGRSLVLWYLLRRRGLNAELVLGAAARKDGDELRAHAWVEVDGEPVNDSPTVRHRFGAFDIRLPPLDRSEPALDTT